MARNDECEKAIKFISNSIKNYTEPESLERWSDLAKTEVGYDKSGHSFSQAVRKQLDNVEDLKGFSLMEKVRLVFLFSRPISTEFEEELRCSKCVVKLNDHKQIMYFRSPDGDCVFKCERHSKRKYFKGKLDKPNRDTRDVDCEKAMRFISNGIKTYTKPESLLRWCDLAKAEVGYDKSAESFRCIIRYRLERIENLKGFSLMEKVQLAFIFSKPVNATFVKKLKDENCIVLLNDAGKIKYFESENGDKILQSDHNDRYKHFKGNPYDDRKKMYLIQVSSSKNVQNSEDSTANNQKQDIEAPGMKEEENKDTSLNEMSNLEPEEDVDVMNESIQQEPPFNGPIDYDDMDDGEYPEFMVPNDDGPPNHHKKRQSELSQCNPKRRKIEKSRESDVEMRSVEVESAQEVEPNPEDSNKPSFGVDNESNNRKQVAPIGDQSIDNNHAETLVQITQKRVKIEEFLEEIEQEPEVWIPEEKPEMPPPTISLLKLAEQIEILAFNINLEDFFQEKALRAVRLFEADNQAIPIQDFNQLFNVFLTSLKRERIQSSNENSMQLSRLFKHLQRTLIRPLGEDLMAEALRMLADEIQKLEGNNEKISLETVQIKLDGLMYFVTNSWAN
ncbi:hypothetical protein B9Z55_027803 [Caenorhabditis nigoni]|uniref:SPK domain-containing protein n=1 Tax=Caenorhabditis nigoni TaxID=1611254 RepID=A0A2G5SEX2_9PELO|nr:hypothetical protein B9Z55_027803 [Caenorhabditis nigoni]